MPDRPATIPQITDLLMDLASRVEKLEASGKQDIEAQVAADKTVGPYKPGPRSTVFLETVND